METLKKLLIREVNYTLPDELLALFLESMTEVRLKPRQPLVTYGTLNTNIYIIKEGILRLLYFDGIKEKTFAFGTPGTVYLSPHSYHMHLPAFMQMESCRHSVVLKISKTEFDGFIKKYHEFAEWVYSIAMGQLFTSELRMSLINGTAKERFTGLAKNRPDLIEGVSMRMIASYLGITPAYLCRLKKELFPAENNSVLL